MTGPDQAEQHFTWNGQELTSLGKLLGAASQAQRDGKAGEFLAAYREYSPFADANLGYLIGYMGDDEERHQMYAAFGLVHPIFGSQA